MRVLLIGHSRIARRRVLPALAAIPEVDEVAIASRTSPRPDAESRLRFFDDYEAAITGSDADLAYISLANSDHFEWAARCLRAGLHVVIDKPACLTAAEARELLDLAASKRRCVAEATVFPFHPQMGALLAAFQERGPPTRAMAAFSFPPLDSRDFRYRSAMGGGALNDLGPYVAATSRVLFGRAPRSVCCRVTSRHADGVETGFSVLLAYDNHGALTGHFGFDTAYQNRLLAFGGDTAVELQRAFTLPAGEAGRLTVKQGNEERAVEVAPSDMFAHFLRAIIGSIESGDWGRFSAALIADAELLAALRQSSGEC